MPRPSVVRRVVLLVLCATLALPLAASAAPSLGRESSWNLRNPAEDFLNWLRLRLDLWGKNGCQVDPDGRPTGTCPSDPPPNSGKKNGCQVDPNGLLVGQCLTEPAPNTGTNKNGCRVDPDGTCIP